MFDNSLLVYIVLIQKKGSFVSQLFSYFKQSPRAEVKFFWTSNSWKRKRPSFSFQNNLRKKLRSFKKTEKSPILACQKIAIFFYNSFFLENLKPDHLNVIHRWKGLITEKTLNEVSDFWGRVFRSIFTVFHVQNVWN